jgi:hypothetical protein
MRLGENFNLSELINENSNCDDATVTHTDDPCELCHIISVKVRHLLTYARQLFLSQRIQGACLRWKLGVIICQQIDQICLGHKNFSLWSDVWQYAV